MFRSTSFPGSFLERRKAKDLKTLGTRLCSDEGTHILITFITHLLVYMHQKTIIALEIAAKIASVNGPIGIQRHEKYKENVDVSCEGPSSGR